MICHGENGVKPFPADHAGRTSDTCQMCHQPGQSEAQATEPAQTTPAPAATAAPTEAETPAASDAPGIPHAIEGQENQCLTCHYTGSIEPFPADHEGFTNQMCLSCHTLED